MYYRLDQEELAYEKVESLRREAAAAQDYCDRCRASTMVGGKEWDPCAMPLAGIWWNGACGCKVPAGP